MTVIEINNIEQVADYRAEWRGLLEQTPRASFFHTPEWLESYWQFFAADQKLRLLMVLEENQLVGVVPLVVRDVQTKLGKIKCLTYPLDDWGAIYGPVGADTKAIMTAACEHLLQTSHDWDIFEPRWVEEGGIARGPSRLAMEEAGMATFTSQWQPVPMLDMSGTLEEYWKTRPGKFRTEQGRNERRLEKRGEIRFVRYRPKGEQAGDGDPRWDLYDICEQIAETSWQGSSTTGTTISHESIREYMRHTHEAAAKNGNLDLNLLYMNDEPIAFTYNYYCHGTVEGIRLGFIKNKETNGAGRVMISKMITDSYERNDQLYIMGTGSLEWKWNWQTDVALTYRHTHYSAKSPRAQLLRLVKRVKSKFTQLTNEANNEQQQADSFVTKLEKRESLIHFQKRLQAYC